MTSGARGKCAAERIAELWMQVQVESLGPAFEFTPDYGVYWAYIPHFIHSPFYVYAYAFGDCLVNALYGVYRDGAVQDFQGKYLDMLRAGGTKRHKELLAPFGLNAADPAFWMKGLDVISGFIDELEQTRMADREGEHPLRGGAADAAHLRRGGRHCRALCRAALPRHEGRQGGACGGSEGAFSAG